MADLCGPGCGWCGGCTAAYERGLDDTPDDTPWNGEPDAPEIVVNCDDCGRGLTEDEIRDDAHGNVVCPECLAIHEDGMFDPKSPWFRPDAFMDMLMGEDR
jgi:hypothetical protein